jgi:mono/diheme cytochrome c family protein
MKKITLRNWLLWSFTAIFLTGCHWDLWNQQRYEPLEEGDFWGEGESASRPIVEGTVPYLGANLDTVYFKGQDANGDFVKDLPQEIVLSKELLERGRDRFNIYCSACHGESGLGNGMITKRGFPAPPSYTDDRLREVPIGYFYDVITNGFGRMYSYATRITVEDRWAIAAYIRVLQLSQHATADKLTENLLGKAKNPPVIQDAHSGGHGAAAKGSHEATSNENEDEVHSEH